MGNVCVPERTPKKSSWNCITQFSLVNIKVRSVFIHLVASVFSAWTQHRLVLKRRNKLTQKWPGCLAHNMNCIK